MSATPRPWTILPKKLMGQYGGLRFLDPVNNIAHYVNEGKDDKWEVIAALVGNEDAALIVEAVNAYDALRAENQALRKALKAFVAWCDGKGIDVHSQLDWREKFTEVWKQAKAALAQIAP